MTPKKIRSEHLRRWRRERNISQLQLAGYLGFTVTTISKWENYDDTVPLWLHWALLGMDQEALIDFDRVTLPR